MHEHNLSIFQRNMLSSFLSEDAKVMYLRGFERNEAQAYALALEWDRLIGPLSDMIVDSGIILSDQKSELREGVYNSVAEVLEFVRERQYRRYFPGN